MKKPRYTNRVPGSDFTCKPVDGTIFVILKEWPLSKNTSPTFNSAIIFLFESYRENLPVKSCKIKSPFSIPKEVDCDKLEIQNLLLEDVSTKVKGSSINLSLSTVRFKLVIPQSVW